MTNVIERGLSSGAATELLLKSGPNEIFIPDKISFFGIAKHEVTEPMILLLFFVGIIYSIWGKLEDAVTIFIVICLLVFAEVYNEFRAKKAISSLEKIAAPKTKVMRDGAVVEIDPLHIVPGDILLLSPGTKIAADAKLTGSIDIQVDESSLTGESFPAEKKDGADIFAGTIIVAGEGLARVTSTGPATKLGKIAATAKRARAPRTPLQLEMRALAGNLVYVAGFFSLMIPVIGWLRGQELRTMILTGLSLAFATIPEELPIVITMVLGLGSYTLSKNNLLIKRIKAAETLGNTTVIVTDKTGTITEGKLSVRDVYPPEKKREVLSFASAATTALSNNILDEVIRKEAANADEISRQRNFSSEMKTNSVIRKTKDGIMLFMKGAPEKILALCPSVDKAGISKILDNETSIGRRVIAVCRRKLSDADAVQKWGKIENNMEFTGLISFEDPARAGVAETIANVGAAGIRTIMVTGDHPATATYIAKQVGILKGSGRIITGDELDKISDDELKNLVKDITVFARTEPEHKYRIVKALQANGEVVSVTGDGVNDALALKAADIGIAMGIRGTDVAKEAAEIVLADDNYITITRGIFEGRKFYDNLKKGIKYYLSVKTALIFIFLLPVIAGLPMPMAPIQIILLELFMDLAASAGFVSEPHEKDIYVRGPRKTADKIINRRSVSDIVLKGSVLFMAVMGAYFYAGFIGLPLHQMQAMAFTAWIFGHIALAYVSRSDIEPLNQLGLFSNWVINLWAVCAITVLVLAVYLPLVGARLDLLSIDIRDFVSAAAFAVLLTTPLEARKMMRKKA